MEKLTDYLEFERLCHDLMVHEGYKDLEPLGGFKDKGRDAIHTDHSKGKTTIFAYSVNENWRKKLEEDAAKIASHKHTCDELVFISTENSNANERDNAIRSIKTSYGWHLNFFGLERLRLLLDDRYPQIKRQHPQIFHPTLLEAELRRQSRISMAESGVLDWERFKKEIITFGKMKLSFKNALEKRLLFRRFEMSELWSQLEMRGSAIVVGSSGVGKTTLSFLLAAELINVHRSGQHIYYCSLSSVSVDVIFQLLHEEDRVFLIIDDAHEDEQLACDIHEQWEVLRDDGDHLDSYLLFLAQPYYGGYDEERPKNIYHRIGQTVDGLPSDEEFSEMARHFWSVEHDGHLPNSLLQPIMALSQRLPAFLPFAIQATALRAGEYSGRFSAKKMRQMFLKSVMAHHRISENQDSARRAAIFGKYNVLIEREAFGEKDVDELLEIGFLARFRRGRFFAVASTTFCQLWLSTESLEEGEIERCFEPYLQHPRSNYSQVLSGMRQNRDFSNLKRLVNNSMQVLRARIQEEDDLRVVTEVLRNVEAISRSNALILLQDYQRRNTLLRAFRQGKIPQLARFLDAATGLTRSLDELRRTSTVDALEQRLIEENPNLTDISRICKALYRVDSERAKGVLRKILGNMGSLATPASDDNGRRALHLLIFASEISGIDSEYARDMLTRFGQNDLYQALIKTRRPFAARRVLKAMRTLSRRKSLEVLQRLLADHQSQDLEAWFSQLVSKPIHLYNLAHLILDVKSISPRSAHDLVERVEGRLLTAVVGESRLPAVGYLLGVLQKTCMPVALQVLGALNSAGNLVHMLHREQSPGRFARTMMAICSINLDPASHYLRAHCDDAELSRRLQRAISLSEAGLFLVAISDIVENPSEVIGRLLDNPLNNLVLEELGLRSTHVEEFHQFVNLLGSSSPLSDDIKQRLAGYFSEGSILHALEVEMRARKVGTALRAYAVCFPGKCRRYIHHLVDGIESQDSDWRSSSELRIKGWLQQENLSSIGFLLNSAASIDARLARAIGDPRFLSPQRVELEVQREGNLVKISEFLFALSSVTQESTQRIVQTIFSSRNITETMDACPDLRAFVTVFQAFREMDQGSYFSWIQSVLKEQRDSLVRELRSRVLEETSLGVIGTCIRLVLGWGKKGDRQMARAIVDQINGRWLMDVARWDNSIVQVMDFAAVATLAHEEVGQKGQRRAALSAPSPKLKIHDLFDTKYLQRLDELRSLDAMTLALLALSRLSERLSSASILDSGWQSLRHDVMLSGLKRSDDTFVCGLMSLLLGQMRGREPASQLSIEAEKRAQQLIGSEDPRRALCAAGLVADGRRVLNVTGALENLFAGNGPELWSVGFANWLSRQRMLILGLPLEQRALINKADFIRHGWTGDRLRQAVEDECARAGGNLFFLFTVMAARQLGLEFEREIEGEIIQGGLKRKDREWRWSVKERLQAYCVNDSEYVERDDLQFVVHAIRKLLPRLEGVVLVDEPEPQTFDVV